MIRALLIDAAGTLIEPAEPVAEVYARHAADHGRSYDPARIHKAFARAFAAGDPDWDRFDDGDTAEREWWRQLVTRVFQDLDPSPWPALPDCFEALFAHYAAPAAWRVFPEVPEVLADARRLGLRCAVVSNFDRRLHGILAGLGLEFDLVLPSADARARKPDTAIFRAALDQLGVTPKEAIHIGDSRRADLEGADSAGIQAFLLDRPRSDLRTAFKAMRDAF